MRILYNDKNLLAICKPYGTPAQKDPSGDPDAMTLASGELSKMGERGELWLVHRLDRTVGGVMVFAKTKAVAADLSLKMAEKTAEKEYLAVIDGDTKGGIFTDFLYKDARLKKAFVTDRKRAGVKEASLECIPLAASITDKDTKTLVLVKLHTGRFHQIRAQLSSRGTPISGDGKYGSRDNRAKQLALFSYKLSFETNNKNYEIKNLPNLDTYPWSLFDSDVYGKIK